MKQILVHAQAHVNMSGVGALQCSFRAVTGWALPLKHHFPHICISLSFPSRLPGALWILVSTALSEAEH